MFSNSVLYIKKQRFPCNFILALVFIFAIPFMLYYGMLLFYDSFLVDVFKAKSFLFYSRWKNKTGSDNKKNHNKCKDEILSKFLFSIWFLLNFIIAHIIGAWIFLIILWLLLLLISLCLLEELLKIGLELDRENIDVMEFYVENNYGYEDYKITKVIIIILKTIIFLFSPAIFIFILSSFLFLLLFAKIDKINGKILTRLL